MTAGDAGISLRLAREADREFLVSTYASARAEELSVVPWSAAETDAFLRQQFDAQDRHYRAHYPSSEFFVIEAEGVPIGRLYLDRAADQLAVMDITLLAEHRGRGIGSALLEDVLDEASARGIPVSLHVEASNPARRLYRRLGFVEVEAGPVYDRLEWRANEAARAC